MYHGIVIVHKEKGFTSHDVVAKMRGICGQKKIGHTGTLDPEATGVLPVCLGNGTRLCDMLTDRDKEYVALLRLGVETDTQDMTGTILARRPVEAGEQQVRDAVLSFQGSYLQTPPMYSALKVNGKKLYELAREGKEVERQAREVQIEEIEILDMHLPTLQLRVVCSKGTYIRTLCADIGQKLGCGGAMESLVRTRVGEFSLKDALTLGQLQELKAQGRLSEAVSPVESVFLSCPVLHVRE
ncbi:MAG: tRNA pseudouridine(55) synthase TruB, partial [Acetatifactor sp.]|nr:tRNA pseudouridine(55) synthase TruB [Acetatifactor sp.]